MNSSRTFNTISDKIINEFSEDILNIASDVPEEYWQIENFLMELPQKWHFSFIVIDMGKPQAYVIGSLKNGAYHIHHFMIADKYRGQGLGPSMLNEVEKRTKKYDLNNITLKVSGSNVKAQNFYLKNGFKIILKNTGQNHKYLLLEKSLIKKRTVAIHQPNYIPWAGYFFKIAHVDTFIFLDDVEYSKNSYINRNQIKTPNGNLWLTVPVHSESESKINEVKISGNIWVKKHLKTSAKCLWQSNFF